MSLYALYCTKLYGGIDFRYSTLTVIFIFLSSQRISHPKNAYLHFDIFLGVTLLMDFYALLVVIN